MDGRSEANPRKEERIDMAEQEPLLTDPSTQDVAAHVHDYSMFTKLLKWGAIVSLVTAFLVILIIQ